MRIEKRLQPSRAMVLLSPVLALLLTLIAGALLFKLLGHPAGLSLYNYFIAPVSDWYGASELVVKVTPLLLCAIGLMLCFKGKVWNIGAEGQFIFAALIAGAVSLQLADAQGFWVLPVIIISGALAGMFWGAVAALLKTHFGASEILTTIMLNYIALNLLLWGVHGPLKDPDGYNFPESALFSDATLLPLLSDDYRITIAVYIALALLAVAWFVLSKTLFGFQIKVLGESSKAAKFAGFSSNRLVWMLLLISGAMAGIAAVSEVNGPVGQLIPTLNLGYGYAAIIVVYMGRMHPIGVLLASILLALTYVGGEMVQIEQGMPKSIVGLFQGMLLFFLLACDVLIQYRFTLPGLQPKSTQSKQVTL